MAIDDRSSVKDAGANPPSTSTGLIQSPDMGEGPNAVSWLVGDVNGDGKAEICQQFRNSNGNLGMILYGWNGSAMAKLWGKEDMGQGPNAQSWLIGDVNADGKAEICQLWDNGGALAINFYMWTDAGFHTTVPTSPGWGGSAEAATAGSDWFIGDVNEDGSAELCHWWSSNIFVGAGLYKYDPDSGKCTPGLGAMSYYGSSAPPPPVGFVLGDFRGKGRKELCEAYTVGGKLGMMLFTFFKGNTLKGKAEWARDNMNQGPNAITWLGGNFMGPIQDGQATVQREQICQLWNNNGKLDMIVYGWKNGSAGFQDGDTGDGDGGIMVLWPTA